MNIERKRKWQLGVALAVMVGGTTWLAAVPGPGTGHSFTPTSLASPFTQDLYATTGNVQPGGVLGGVAFAPDGRVWSAECNFLGTRLHRFAGTTTAINGSSVHEEELVVDLTASGMTSTSSRSRTAIPACERWTWSSTARYSRPGTSTTTRCGSST